MKRLLLLSLTLAGVAAVPTAWVLLSDLIAVTEDSRGALSRFAGAVALAGLAGALYSTLFARSLALSACGGRVIGTPADERDSLLLAAVARLAEKACIPVPQVVIFRGEPNAFSAGRSRGLALLAVSDGLLHSLGRRESEGVLAHEIAHIANGDMVTLEMLQGVLNVFVVWPALAMDALSRTLQAKTKRRRVGTTYDVTYLAGMLLFGLLAGLLVAWFSRRREFRADRLARELTGGHDHLTSALNRLGTLRLQGLHGLYATAGIAGARSRVALFASHPGFDRRIRALKG